MWTTRRHLFFTTSLQTKTIWVAKSAAILTGSAAWLGNILSGNATWLDNHVTWFGSVNEPWGKSRSKLIFLWSWAITLAPDWLPVIDDFALAAEKIDDFLQNQVENANAYAVGSKINSGSFSRRYWWALPATLADFDVYTVLVSSRLSLATQLKTTYKRQHLTHDD